MNREVQRVDDNVVELYKPPTAERIIYVNEERVFSAPGTDSLEEEFYNLLDALQANGYEYKEWIKDREKSDDYPEGDDSLDRFVLKCELPDGGVEVLKTSDEFDELEGVLA